MRGDVLPSKRQAVVDRLRRRFELYRRHHNSTLPRYEGAANAVYEEQRQETLILKQRYLESKAKKAKKNEHKSLKDSSAATSSTESQKNLMKMNKRSAANLESPLESTVEGGQTEDKDQRPCKMPRSSTSTPDKHLETQQGQSIPSFDCIKQQSTSQITPVAPRSPAAPGTTHGVGLPLRSVKKENVEFCGGGSHSCAHARDSAATSTDQHDNSDIGEKFLDVFPNLALPEDSSEVWVDNPEILRHLIDDITNPSDLMTDFNFSYGIEKDADGVEMCKSEAGVTSSVTTSIKKSGQALFSVSESFQTVSQASQQMLGFEQRVASTVDTLASSSTSCLPQQSFSPSNQRTPSQFSSGMSGIDFKLSEPSPAAQTLKQMAEQHQQHKQNHDKHSMGLPSLNARGNFASNDNFEASLGPTRSTVFSTTDNSLNQAIQTSNLFHNVGYGGQAMTSSIASHAEGGARSVLPEVAFGKSNGSPVSYTASNRDLVKHLPQLRMQEPQKCAPKVGQYANSNDEKAAFLKNFKAGLAQFNDPPSHLKNPPPFTKRMSPSPMAMGPSGHSTAQVTCATFQAAQVSVSPKPKKPFLTQGSQGQQQRTSKDIKASPRNISSNPSYIEALAFSSGNSVHSCTNVGSPHFQQAQMQHGDQAASGFQPQYLDTSQIPRPMCSSPADHQHHYVQAKASMAPSHLLQHYGGRPPNPVALPQRPVAQTMHKPTRQPISIMGNQLSSGLLPSRQTTPQFINRAVHMRTASGPSQVLFQPANQITNQMNFTTTPKMATPLRGQQQPTLQARQQPTSTQSAVPLHKLVYTNAVMRPQRMQSQFASPQRDWQRMVGMPQVCFQQPQQQQQQTRPVVFNSTSRAQFQPQEVHVALPPLPQLQIPMRNTAPQSSNFSPSLTSSISDFNLEFLESIENSDSDLLNFDPVNSNYGILDDVLGGK